jgi:hypothetical protein
MPLQSLSLLNSEFAVRRASEFAFRIKKDSGGDVVNRINRAFMLVAGRKADAEELKLSQKFLGDQQEVYKDAPMAEDRAWADFCQSLFASNDFLYLQ